MLWWIKRPGDHVSFYSEAYFYTLYVIMYLGGKKVFGVIRTIFSCHLKFALYL